MKSGEESKDTRTRILEAASRLFHEQGFAATGVATILREAGVNSGSLYHFFPSKEALLQGVLEWYLERLYPEIMQPVELDEPEPLARIFKLLGWYRSYLVAHDCQLGCPVGNLALEVSDTHPDLKQLLHRNFCNWTGVLERWLEEAGAQLPGDCDRRAMARFVLTVMEGGVMQSRVAGSPEPFDESVAQLEKYFASLAGQSTLRRMRPAQLA